MTAKDTLAFQLGQRPGTMYRNMAKVPTENVVKAMIAYEEMLDDGDNEDAHVHPEHEAITFYLMNHVVGLVSKKVDRDDPLSQYFGLVDQYQNNLTKTASRLFYYLLMICTRETRHIHNLPELKPELLKQYGSACVGFLSNIKGTGSGSTVEKLKSHPPKADIGVYTDFMVHVFEKGQWSSGYGGKAWADVAKVLNEFVHGRYSAEMMVDVGWTLCHNGGPIFNKGMLYHHYNQTQLVKILDVQRSGQIPELVEELKGGGSTTSAQVDYLGHAKKALGTEDMGDYVDWFLVKELGGVGHYGSEQDHQKKKYGMPKHLVKKAQEAHKKKLEAEMKAAALKAAQEEVYFKVMPGLQVKKLVRGVKGFTVDPKFQGVVK